MAVASFTVGCAIDLVSTGRNQHHPNAAGNGDFSVPPLPYTIDDVQVTGDLVMGSRQPVTISTVAKVALLRFAGTQGQQVSMQISDITLGSLEGHSTAIALYTPERTPLQTPWSVGSHGGFIDALSLPTTGMYTLVVDPDTTDVGSLTLTLHNLPPDVPGSLALNGPALTTAVSVPGQNPVLRFSGTAGQQVTVTVTNNTLCGVQVFLYGPDMIRLDSFSTDSCVKSFNLATQTLPVTGAYLIVIDPSQENLGSFTLSATSP
ncbi:MAG: hypothetical protein ACRERD_28140 [Candidatus Binatia bacterium]